MEHADLTVLNKAINWLENGESVFLISVLKTWGSSPRPMGSIMAISKSGALTGSVSSGCIEEDLLERIHHLATQPQIPGVLTFGENKEEQQRYQLPCGGTVELLIESLDDISQLHEIAQHIKTGNCICRNVNLNTGIVTLEPVNTHTQPIIANGYFQRIFGPMWRLFIIGAGELSSFVARMAMPLGYQVTICDPRHEYVNSWDVANTTVIQQMPDDVIRESSIDSRCAILTLTHDPKIDDMALLEALETKAFYVGALGSKANNAARRERLELMGISHAKLASLHGPVGLSINSKMPAEIAISILAEMVSIRNGNTP